MKDEKKTGVIAQGMKMYPEVKALKVSYISLQDLLSLSSLMCLVLVIAFSRTAYWERKEKQKLLHFSSY